MRTHDKAGARKRAAPRVKIFQAGELRCGAGAIRRVHLLNISTGGALIHAGTVPEVGEQVWLACGIPLGSARVRWRSGQRFGVAFALPIVPALIDSLLGMQEASAQTQMPRRVAVAKR